MEQARRYGFGAFVKTEGKTMPFDGVGFGFDDRVGKIDKVINLLATPHRWCKGTLRTHDGRHCIRGAIMAGDWGATCHPRVSLPAHQPPSPTYPPPHALHTLP